MSSCAAAGREDDKTNVKTTPFRALKMIFKCFTMQN
jgi:hypothetical protein